MRGGRMAVTRGVLEGATRNSESHTRTPKTPVSPNTPKRLKQSASRRRKSLVVQVDSDENTGSTKILTPKCEPPEHRAANLIIRAWRKRRHGMLLDRKNFIERLKLEDAVCVGVSRLICFVVLFIMLYQVTQLGVQSGERRAAELVLTQTLDLESFEGVRTLPAYREEMVKFSTAIKEFSASGSLRFPNEDAVLIVGNAQTYSQPKVLTGLDLNVMAEEFTITAWVEVTDQSHKEKPLLRKPMQTDPSVSCWGWYFPSRLHFGAHDYHSVTMDSEHVWEFSVGSETEFPTSFFNHEAMVVHNHKVTFYRNGQELNPGGTQLPRTLTDCDGAIEIGGAGLQLSSVKFYPRPLNKAEIQEINVNGQPLSEIATGSVLRRYEESEHDAVIVEVDAVAQHTDQLLEDKDQKRVLDDIVADAELGESHAVTDAALHPSDSSPPATLPPTELESFLPAHELHEWQAGGSLRDMPHVLVDQWTCDADVLPSTADNSHRRSAASEMTGNTTVSSYSPSIVYDATTVCAHSSARRATPDPGAYWSVVGDPMYAKASRDAEEDVAHESTDEEPLVGMNLTAVPDDAHALTFAFWVKATDALSRFSLMLRIGELYELDTLAFHLVSNGAGVLRVTDTHGHSWQQLLDDSFAASQVEGPLSEKFFITAVDHDPMPTVWRHVAVVFHLEEGFHESYLDGRLVKRHAWHDVAHIPMSAIRNKKLNIAQAPWWGNVDKTVAKIAKLRMYPRALAQAEIQNIQDNSQWPDHTRVKQCHVRPAESNRFEPDCSVTSSGHSVFLRLFLPGGSCGFVLKDRNEQEVSEDSFKDSDGVDHHGRSCSWYHEMMERSGSSLICTAASAKAMCPLTCRGERECSSGFPFDLHVHDEHHERLRSHSHQHYRIFDRVMHLKPSVFFEWLPHQAMRVRNNHKSGPSAAETLSQQHIYTDDPQQYDQNRTPEDRSEDVETIICPGKSLDKAALLAQCNDPVTGNASYDNVPHFYETWEESVADSWAAFQRADLRLCEQLDERLDFDQCAWDDSWVPDFMRDLHEMEQFAVNWWSQPAQDSRLPATSLNMFSSLSPPRTLLDVREQDPFKEAITRLAVPTSDGQLWSSVNHHGTIDFQNAWTYYYVKFQKIKTGEFQGQWQVCLAVNGFPLDCQHSMHLVDFHEHPGQPFPEQFLQALEVTTEVFMSPIEWSTEVLSVPEVQEQYYRMAPKMKRMTGPRLAELERIAVHDTPPEKQVHSFSERLLLAAPPFLYQQRSIAEQCPSRVMDTFLEKQLTLIQGTHCTSGGHGDICPTVHTVQDVYSCKGRTMQTSGSHYGQTATAMNISDPPTFVFADFLYSVADNEVLVRGERHDILPAAEFVDRSTEEAVILCLFHTPESGDTTVLDVRMKAHGSKVHVTTDFSHFGFLQEPDKARAVAWWSVFFALCACTLLLNSFLFWVLFREAREFPEVGWDLKGVGECVYDVFQIVMLVAYGAVKMSAQLGSEAEAQKLVDQFVEIPFRDSDETVQNKINKFFGAVTAMRQLLSAETTLLTFGFFAMILMLIRIINATAVHPRTGVLIGTVWHGLTDIWHFAILFLLVFVFSSMVASWSFGTRDEFEDLETSMQTQFDLLLGSLPPGFNEDPLLIIYVALTVIVQFFLMLNFLLAIVVESYMKVRMSIEELETDNEVLYDVVVTLRNSFRGAMSSWPHRRRIATLLTSRCARKRLTWVELHVLGLPHQTAQAMLQWYGAVEVLRAGPVENEDDEDDDDVSRDDGAEKMRTKQKLDDMEATMMEMKEGMQSMMVLLRGINSSIHQPEDTQHDTGSEGNQAQPRISVLRPPEVTRGGKSDTDADSCAAASGTARDPVAEAPRIETEKRDPILFEGPAADLKIDSRSPDHRRQVPFASRRKSWIDVGLEGVQAIFDAGVRNDAQPHPDAAEPEHVVGARRSVPTLFSPKDGSAQGELIFKY